MLPLASFLVLQEIPRRPFSLTYARQTYLAQGRGLLLASSWYKTLVGGGNQTIYSCGIADFVLKQQFLHFGWHFAGLALWCHYLLSPVSLVVAGCSTPSWTGVAWKQGEGCKEKGGCALFCFGVL